MCIIFQTRALFSENRDIYDNVTKEKSNKVLLFSDRCLCRCSFSKGTGSCSGTDTVSLTAPGSQQGQ